jgi:hypothetical protein
VVNELEILVTSEMADVRGLSGDEIIDSNHAMPFGQKPVREMRTEKARASGHDRNRLGIFCHWAILLTAAAQLYQHEVRLTPSDRES